MAARRRSHIPLCVSLVVAVVPRLVAQTPVIRITPPTQQMWGAASVAVTIDWCGRLPHLYDPNTRVITRNGADVTASFTTWVVTDNPDCPGQDDFAERSTGTVTLVAGFNTLYAEVREYGGAWPYAAQTNYQTQPNPPWIGLGPHNGYHRNAGLCAAECFDAKVSFTTPAYWSFDAPRAVTLLYSSGQVSPRHTIQLDVMEQNTQPADKLSLRLRRVDGSYVAFTNGSTELFFWGGTGTHRLAAQFEDSTLATGAYSYTVVVRAEWAAGFISESQAAARLLVLNERQSPYGAGWTVAGVPRLKVALGDSLVLWDGTGSVSFWARSPCDGTGCWYQAPRGDFATLRFTYLAARSDPTIAYERTELDGTKLRFDDQGRARYIDDLFGNRVTYVWLDANRLQQIRDPAGKTVTFGYNGSSKLAWIRDDPGLRTTNVTIDASNHLIQILDPAGGLPFKDGQYDAAHRLRSYRDRRGALWSKGYDFAGRLVSDSSPAVTADGVSQRLVTLYRSPESAVLIDPATGRGGSTNPAFPNTVEAGKGRITDPSSIQTVVTVDAFGAAIAFTAPLSGTRTFSRNEHSQVTGATDPDGHSVSYSWSGPRLIHSRDAATKVDVFYEWNTTYNRVTRRYGDVPEVRNYYGINGRLDSTRVANQPVTKLVYDALGRVITVTDPRGHASQYFYASSGFRNTDSVRTGTRVARFAYDGWGRTVKMVNPRGDADTVVYDVLNRAREERGPLGHRVTYAYADSFNLTAVTDARGQVYSTERNLVGWDTASVDPAGQRQRYAYDKAGRVRTWTNRRGQATTFVYDGQGRLSSRGLADGRTTGYAYGTHWVAVANGEGSDTLRFAPDTMFEIAVRGGVAHRVRSLMDSTARFSIVAVWRDGQSPYEIRYDKDSLGRVWKLTPTGANPDTLVYNTDGQLVRVKWHGAQSGTLASRSGHELARVSYTGSAVQAAVGAEFAHDSLSRIAEHVNGTRDQFEKYGYDALGRVMSYERRTASPPCAPTDTLSEFGARCSSPGSVLAQGSYGYDSVGNRVDGATIVDPGNRIRSLAGYTLQYDADGNVTRKYLTADSVRFNQRLYWNSASELDSVRTTKAGSTTTVKLGYDGSGRRVRKTVGTQRTWYVYHSQHVVAEFDGAGALLRHYTYYPGTDRPHSLLSGGARSYFLNDGRGNVGGLMSADGSAMLAQYRYTPFGDSASENGTVANNLRFASREFDLETRLYYNRARYYDPQLGRFVSEDPIGLAGGINSYVHADGDPINGADPSGLCGPWCFGALVGAGLYLVVDVAILGHEFSLKHLAIEVTAGALSGGLIKLGALASAGLKGLRTAERLAGHAALEASPLTLHAGVAATVARAGKHSVSSPLPPPPPGTRFPADATRVAEAAPGGGGGGGGGGLVPGGYWDGSSGSNYLYGVNVGPLLGLMLYFGDSGNIGDVTVGAIACYTTKVEGGQGCQDMQ